MRSTAVISSKGQIVIPAGLRKKHSLETGSTVLFREERGRIVIESADFDSLYALEGSLRGLPLEADLEEMRRNERRREDAR